MAVAVPKLVTAWAVRAVPESHAPLVNRYTYGDTPVPKPVTITEFPSALMAVADPKLVTALAVRAVTGASLK